jgi:hypothetical protein
VGEVTLPPGVEYEVRVGKLRDSLDYASVARDLLDSLIVDVAREALEISTTREERRLSMLVHAVDRWSMLLDESVRLLQKAREYLLSVKEGAEPRR